MNRERLDEIKLAMKNAEVLTEIIDVVEDLVTALESAWDEIESLNKDFNSAIAVAKQNSEKLEIAWARYDNESRLCRLSSEERIIQRARIQELEADVSTLTGSCIKRAEGARELLSRNETLTSANTRLQKRVRELIGDDT